MTQEMDSKPGNNKKSKNRRRRRRKIRLVLRMASIILCILVVLFCGFKVLSTVKNSSPDSGTKELFSKDSRPNTPQSEWDAVSAQAWNLVLVNPWNPIREGDVITLKELGDGQAVDERCYPDLQKMMEACREAGLSPHICSSYRTKEKQERLYNNKVDFLTGQGCSPEEAQAEAAAVVAVPGTSEHQLGLALDIVDSGNQMLDNSQENTQVQRWLMENSWRYGFILRYPADKCGITGIIYEPWHYRYVGRTAAEEIYRRGICLEEYLSSPL